MAFTDYAETSALAQKTMTSTVESWSDQIEKLLDRIPSLGIKAGDLHPAFERCFELAGRAFEANRDYFREVTGASLNLRRATLEYSHSITRVLRDQAGVAVQAVRLQAESLEQAGRTTGAMVSDAARNGTVTHDDADHDRAVARYAALTKSELSEKLAERSLPRTGTLDELRDRLIEADLHLG